MKFAIGIAMALPIALLSTNVIGAEGNSSANSRFAGSWELLSVERRDSEGAWGPTEGQLANPIGLLMYDTVGQMSVHIMNPDRVAVAASGADLTREQLLERMRGYVAYFGTFDVNEQEGFVIHHRRGHLNPNQVGIDAKRFFEFTDDKLTLTVARGRNFRLTWQRVDRQRVSGGFHRIGVFDKPLL